MKIAAQDEKGKPIVRDATPEELAAMQPTAQQIALEQWNSEFDWKVIVPADWLEDPQFFGISSWAVHNRDKMEIQVRGEEAHVYYNVLKDNHVGLITNLGLTQIPKPT